MAKQRDTTYSVAIVKYGHRDTMRSHVYLHYDAYHQPDGPIGMDYFVWLVRNDTRTILIDTGYSALGGARRHRKTLIDPACALELLGVDPTSPIDILLTHAHYDHCGNLDRFPNATVTASRREIEFWASDRSRHVVFRHPTDEENIAYLGQVAAEDRLNLIEGRVEFAPGIEIIPTGGHTPGQYMVRVDTGHGHVLLTSDAAHYYEEYERDMPFVLVVEPQAMLDGLAAIRAFERSGDLVIPGHDPLVFERIPPLQHGPLAGNVAMIEWMPPTGTTPGVHNKE